MIRTICVLAGIAIGITGVAAQGDAIAERKELMKGNAQHTKGISAMVKGEAPFDAAAVNAAFTQWSATAAAASQAVPGQFEDRRRDPRAAEDLGRSQRLRRADRRVHEGIGGAAEGSEALKTAFPAVAKVCGDCHEGYRAAAKK